MSVFARLVEYLAELLQPLFHGSAAAAAIVLFTALVRLLVHPLSRAAARGQKARTALQPQLAELRRKHAKNPERLQRAVLELHTEHKVSPLAGCLPGLLQAPAFILLYHLFSSQEIGGRANELLAHELFTAPLGGRFTDALALGGAAGFVYPALFLLVLGVALFNFRRSKVVLAGSAPLDTPGAGAVAKVMPFISFFTLVTVAVVPLAAALYVVTSSTWSAVERAALYR
ncbi:YidC/Oxa1 family membrane protein insertase [Streptomyces sp. NPDC058867]|uniref:YidC/Oxa1 family membrane protein insertase n=1 Tax=unclassified Streptomyces TaxID=2593676 RepID=UPI0036C4C16A